MDERSRKIQEHLDAIRRLEAEAARKEDAAAVWPPDQFYLLWHVVVGMMFGAIGALVSLAANMIGAPLFGEPPLQLIRVYLTFPMGERALDAEQGLVLTVGIVLYLITGALYGIAFHLGMRFWFRDASPLKKFIVGSLFGLGLWIVNFYLILSWLQPLLLGGNWIVRLVPIWVGALTHLAFAWTMLLTQSWSRFEQYRPGSAVMLVATLLLAGCGGAAPDEARSAGETAPAAAAQTAANEGRPLEYPKWETNNPGEFQAYNRRANLVQRGHDVYAKYCEGCHGFYGDGNGPAAVRLITQPRDFTSGVYKFRSTDSGSLPMESDLYRTLVRGLSGVSMPAFPLMPHRDKLAVIEYIKGFYPRWDDERDDRVIVPVPKAPTDLADARRVLRGRAVYIEMQCGQCHGIDGQGTGATRTEYVDAWGNPQKPFNFTRGSLKGGNSPEDIYRTFHTGLRSIMPSYGGTTLAAVVRESLESNLESLGAEESGALAPVLDSFPATAADLFALSEGEQERIARENSWDLVAYILSLRNPTTTAAAVLGTAE